MTASRKFAPAIAVFAVAALVTTFLVQTRAEGGTLGIVNIPAPSFVDREYSVHNKQGASVCGNFIQTKQAGENIGDLDNSGGSYLHGVALPQGVVVKRLSLFVNDFDAANDVHAFLVRKKIANKLDPKSAGYRVMAKTKSAGAVNNVMRRFSDSTVGGAVIDNTRFMYYVEMVVCPITEPFAVRIVYER